MSKTSSKQTATTRILCRRFPGTCEKVGQVFNFVWRLHWKINVVCTSLSPFDSFQSRFLTYLLTFPGILLFWLDLTTFSANSQVLWCDTVLMGRQFMTFQGSRCICNVKRLSNPSNSGPEDKGTISLHTVWKYSAKNTMSLLPRIKSLVTQLWATKSHELQHAI